MKGFRGHVRPLFQMPASDMKIVAEAGVELRGKDVQVVELVLIGDGRNGDRDDQLEGPYEHGIATDWQSMAALLEVACEERLAGHANRRREDEEASRREHPTARLVCLN